MRERGRTGTLGTFAGVFTPSILTILGVILFLRMGFVVGSAGLGRALLIIALAKSSRSSPALARRDRDQPRVQRRRRLLPDLAHAGRSSSAGRWPGAVPGTGRSVAFYASASARPRRPDPAADPGSWPRARRSCSRARGVVARTRPRASSSGHGGARRRARLRSSSAGSPLGDGELCGENLPRPPASCRSGRSSRSSSPP